MGESVYKIIDLVGSSPNSWEEAAKNAIDRAGQSVRDMRIAEVQKFDIKIQEGQPLQFRTNIRLSFKFEG